MLAGLLAGGPGAAASPADPLCDGARPTLSAHLLFGLSRPDGGRVGAAAWRRFLAERITPRFPAGLTVLSARGLWRAADGRPMREGVRVVLVVTDETPEAVAALRAIRAEYRALFAQEAVGLVLSRSCSVF